MGAITAVSARWELKGRQVRERRYRAPSPRERERRYGLRLLAQGWSANKVTDLLGHDPHTIGSWFAASDRDDSAVCASEQTGDPPPWSPESERD